MFLEVLAQIDFTFKNTYVNMLLLIIVPIFPQGTHPGPPSHLAGKITGGTMSTEAAS